MMQRTIYICCLALSLVSFFPQSSFAQKGKSEVSVAWGPYSIYTFLNERPYDVSSGTGMISYKYYLSKRTTLGMVVAYENLSNWGSYLTFAPEATYAYYDNKDARIRVKMYGSASLGLTVFDDFAISRDLYTYHRDESGAKITGHISPFGIRIGRKLGGFMELGLGYKGLFNFGMSYRFKTKGWFQEQPHND